MSVVDQVKGFSKRSAKALSVVDRVNDLGRVFLYKEDQG